MKQRESRTLVSNCLVELENKSSNTKLKQYKVSNISRGGLCFESIAEEFQLNEVIELNLIMSEDSIHKATGRVCYCNQSNQEKSVYYGLSFLDKFIDNDVLRAKAAL